MKKITVIALLLAAALGAQARNGSGKPAYKDAGRPVEERVSDLLSRMTLEEKVMQLNQYTLGRNDNANNVADPVDKIPAEIGSLIYFDTSPGLRNRLQKKAIEQSRLGIPVLFGYDVIHGFRTTYPISLAQACSWNPALVKQAAEVAAQEARMSGVEWTFSPMIDVARDGRWGRVSEGYGEDPYANAVYGVAAVEGYQGDNLADSRRVAACLKHFVGYGASEAGRDYVYTEISRQTLWDTYIPPYQAGIEAGAATVMSCFNDISGTPGTANPYILTEVLKERWAHDGFVVSDWAAIEQLRSQGVAADRKEAAEKAAYEAKVGHPVHDFYWFTDLYKQMPFGNPAYHELFRLLEEHRVPLLFHCTCGKDRTGIAAMLVLLALGVSREDAIADYMLTNVYRKAIIDKFMQDNPADQYDLLLPVEGVSESMGAGSIDVLLEKYPSYEAYFEAEYGLTTARLAALRDFYLE